MQWGKNSQPNQYSSRDKKCPGTEKKVKIDRRQLVQKEESKTVHCVRLSCIFLKLAKLLVF